MLRLLQIIGISRRNEEYCKKTGELMNPNITSEERKFRLTSEERASWDENGYFVRFNVFTKEENDVPRQIADDIAEGRKSFPDYHIFQNALVRDGKIKARGIYAMHNIQYVSCNC